MPATRATGMATPVSASPNNNCPTSGGTISNANPVTASAIARLVRRTLLTDENVEETGIRFDHLTLAANASFRFEPSARSMVWFQVLEGDAKLKAEYMDGLSDRHSVFLPPAFDATLSTERRQSFWRWLFHQEDTRGVSLLRAEIPDARRFDPEFSTKQPLFAVLDWTREMVLQCKNDGRKRVPLLTAETCQTAALKVQMVIYPPGTKSASYRHEGAESFGWRCSGNLCRGVSRHSTHRPMRTELAGWAGSPSDQA
jgi:hypothetical protein